VPNARTDLCTDADSGIMIATGKAGCYNCVCAVDSLEIRPLKFSRVLPAFGSETTSTGPHAGKCSASRIRRRSRQVRSLSEVTEHLRLSRGAAGSNQTLLTWASVLIIGRNLTWTMTTSDLDQGASNPTTVA
jgi:hypothetical protein